MGNFVGHILPGSLFIIFSIIWTINLLRLYYRTKSRKHGLTDDASTVSFEFKKFSRPIESLALVAILPIAIMGEYLTGFYEGPTICNDNLQHMTMYSFFLILYTVNLLEIYTRAPLPSIVDPLCCIAFGVETLLLYFHTHGQGLVEQHLHKLLTFASFMCSLTSLMAGIFKQDIIVQLAKPAFILLQGTWFCQIAFLLYPIFEMHPVKHVHHHNHSIAEHLMVNANDSSALIDHIETHHQHDHHTAPPEDPNAHHNIMATTAYFCWHFGFSIITIYVLAFVCRKKFFKQQFLNQKYQRLLEETSCSNLENLEQEELVN